MSVEYESALDEPNYKSITKNIKEINNKTINTVLRIKYSFYNNTSENSTYFVALVEYEKKDREYEYYNKTIAITTLTEYCLNIHDFLDFWNNSLLQVESIVINRPMIQIWKYLTDENLINVIINKEKNVNYQVESVIKKNKIIIKIKGNNDNKELNGILLMKISPITTYVCIENTIPLFNDGKYLASVSSKNQKLLKKFRTSIESITALTY